VASTLAEEYAGVRGFVNCFAIDHINNLPSAYASGKHADAVVVCRGHEFKVHKLVLSDRSDFFDKVFNGQFQVRSRSHGSHLKLYALTRR